MDNLYDVLGGAMGFWLISAAVYALPMPDEKPQGFWPNFYSWLYKFTHKILANFDRAKMTKPNGGDNESPQ